MTTALLDGDILAYVASSVGESDIDWGDGEQGKTIDEQVAIEQAMRQASDWIKKADCRMGIVCFTDRTIPMSSFRYLYHPLYKRNRKDPKPELYWKVVEALTSEYRTITMPRLEADDVMGIWATNGRLSDPVIVSTDKDMRNVPARLFIPGKMPKPVTIRKAQAFMHWMFQTLKGDVVDNFKGCPGVGEKKATELLQQIEATNYTEVWEMVVEQFKKKKLTEDHAIAEARMARILMAHDYNEEKQEFKLWHPTRPQWLALRDLPLPSASPSTAA
jgi:DNA polymerase-1